MNKTRLEAFSDGVFAIVITLLILDVRIHDVEYAQLPDALSKIVPSIISYVISFAVIGVYWFAHHYYFKFVKKVNSVFVWLNTLLLLLVSFIPFPTSLLGAYPFQSIPVFIYGINLLALNSVTLVMLFYLYRHRELAAESLTKEAFKDFLWIYIFVNVAYLVAIILSFFLPTVSYLIYIAVLVILIILFVTRER